MLELGQAASVVIYRVCLSCARLTPSVVSHLHLHTSTACRLFDVVRLGAGAGGYVMVRGKTGLAATLKKVRSE